MIEPVTTLPLCNRLLLFSRRRRAHPLVLDVELAALNAACRVAYVVRFPGRGTDEPDRARFGVVKHIRDLLQRFVGRLGKQEKHMNEHGGAEDGKNDIGAPCDVCERAI